MRKVILGLLFFSLSVAQGQIFSNPIKIVAADPSGSCAPRTIALSVATGAAFYCASNNSMWAQFANPSAGSGTVINDATLTANAVLIGNGTVHAKIVTLDTTTTHALFATAGAPEFRAIVAGDIPTLNQNTTGTAATITGALAVANTPLTTTQDILYLNGAALGRLPIVTNGQCLGATAGAWASLACAGGGGSPGGVDTNIQFNDSSSFGGDAKFTVNKTTGAFVLNKLSCVGSPVTCTLYDDTATTGRSRINIRLGDTQLSGGLSTDSPLRVLRSDGTTEVSGIDSSGAFFHSNGTTRVNVLGGSGALLSADLPIGWSNTSGDVDQTIDTGFCRGAAGQVNINDGSTTCTNLRDILARTLSSGDGTVAGEDKLLELTANGNNYRSWLAPDSLTADLRLKFPDTTPSADGIMLFPSPTTNVSQFAWTSFPSCPDTGGNHLNFSSPTISCGTSSSGGSSNIFDYTKYTITESFPSANALSAIGAIGQNAWSETTTGSGGVNILATESKWEGGAHLGTGTTSTSDVALYLRSVSQLTDGGWQGLDSASAARMEFLFRTPDGAATNAFYQIGILDDPAIQLGTSGRNFLYLRYKQGTDTNWVLQLDNAGTVTTACTGSEAPSSSNYYILKMAMSGTSTVTVNLLKATTSYNGASSGTDIFTSCTATLPTPTGGYSPAFYVSNNGTTSAINLRAHGFFAQITF